MGEIESEYELPDPQLSWVGERAVQVAGSMSIDDFNESTETELPVDGPRTLAGLVFDALGRGAVEGDAVELGGATLRVAQVEGARIVRIRAELAQPRTRSR